METRLYKKKFATTRKYPKTDPRWITLDHHLSISKRIVLDNQSIYPSDPKCRFDSCFDIHRCACITGQPSVYVYPSGEYWRPDGVRLDKPISREFREIVETVRNSSFHESNPGKACLFLPSIDLLNENNLRTKETARILASLSHWNKGRNHLLISMLIGTQPSFHPDLTIPHGNAILAASGLSLSTYRYGFDVAVPLYNPVSAEKLPFPPPSKGFASYRKFLLMSTQFGIANSVLRTLLALSKHLRSRDLLLLDRCPKRPNDLSSRCDGLDVKRSYEYPQVMQEAEFCLIVKGSRLLVTALYDAMRAGCIPVIVSDSLVLPFQEILDWSRFSIRLKSHDLTDLMKIIRDIPRATVAEMRDQLLFIFGRYMKGMGEITTTILTVLTQRACPAFAKPLQHWNQRNTKRWSVPISYRPVLPSDERFTAVILGYERVEPLLALITLLDTVPSLAKIIVVWNNQDFDPPKAWPSTQHPLRLIRTPSNSLNNRFIPYDDIETDAVLSIDDDITMVTRDELEFGFQVWRYYPNQLVGMPQRLHEYNSTMARWDYITTWRNELSLILTGCAFLHKHYLHLYTHELPAGVKKWVDTHMNCEDIAMNFLVANATGLPPIKVLPRKKFSISQRGLSFDRSHFELRSQCINHFIELFGGNPLRTTELRVDPVLFGEKLRKGVVDRFDDVCYL